MLKQYPFKKVYICCGYTDLRYGINALPGIIEKKFNGNIFEEDTLFLFCGRKSDRIKGLLWEGDGFLLLYKRVEKGSFRWPRNKEEVKEIDKEQFNLFLRGLTFEDGIEKIYPRRVM